MPKQQRLTAAEYQGGEAKKAKPSKYLNHKVVVDGIKFDSKKEAARWVELKILEGQDEIQGLRRQVKRDLVVNEIKICRYVSDFEYHRKRRGPYGHTWDYVIEDVKSSFTRTNREYRIKKKLFEAIFAPLTITEV